MKHALCPHCGMDIELDVPIRIDHFTMTGPGYPLTYQGREIILTPGERIIAWSLLKAYPSEVHRWTLLERLGSPEAGSNLVQVLVCRLRKKMSDAGAPAAVENVWGKGYRWKPGDGHAVAETVANGTGSIRQILNQLYTVPGVTDPKHA